MTFGCLRRYLFKDGNGTVFNDDLTAGTDSTSRCRRRRRSARRIVHHKLWFIAHPLWGTD
jgi:hypothetical protein